MVMTDTLYPLLSINRLRMGIDGQGITTLVAGAYCPLHCRWCINRQLLREAPAALITVRELLERVRVDDLYFRATNGGVTFGGGESLLHAPFIRGFREICPSAWRINVETSLAVDRELVIESIDAVDFYIIDCKDMNPDIYNAYTGGSQIKMLENLRYLLSAVGAERVFVRVPLIPGYNTPEDQQRSAETLRAMGVTQLDLFEYVRREQ